MRLDLDLTVPEMFAAGFGLAHNKHYDAAIAAFRAVIAEDPKHSDALVNLASFLANKGEFAEATAFFNRALTVDQNNPLAWFNYGKCLTDQNQFSLAETFYNRAIALKNDFAVFYDNLGYALNLQGRYAEAVTVWNKAVEVDPTYHAARKSRGLIRMLTAASKDDWLQGWSDYESRLAEFKWPCELSQVPVWNPEMEIDGKRALVVCDQGFGDTVQFLRYIPLLKKRCSKVFVITQPGIAGLVRMAEGPDEVFAMNDGAVRAADFQVALLSLPLVLRDGIPPDVPPPVLIPHSHEVYGTPHSDPRIGICWKGNPAYPLDKYRSIPLKEFLTCLDGIEPKAFVCSLQYETTEEERILMKDLRDYKIGQPTFGNWLETFKAIESCDIVVSVDTMTAHLAGTLGVRTLLLLPHICDWRWQLGSDRTPWYEKHRLFRQDKFMDWSGPLQDVNDVLITDLGGNTNG